MNYLEEYKDCLDYIDSYWDEIIHKPARRKIARKMIMIPYPFITPNNSFYNTIFYWDTYFMFKGIMGTKRARIMKYMVDNFIYLFNTYDVIPNSNDHGRSNRSQPPFLTSMILDVFTTPHAHNIVKANLAKLLPQLHNYQNKLWLRNAIEVAKKEYLMVWLDIDGGYNHKVEGYSLSKYGDRDVGYSHSAELESGWDMTSRFYNRCSDFLPIDLNVYLYKYEKDFAFVAPLFNEDGDQKYWEEAAKNRKAEINKYMWNEKEGFFYDYGYSFKAQSEFLSLGGFTPMWAGIATAEQANRMVQKIEKFETNYGLAITARESLAKPIDLSTIQKRYHPAIHEIIDPKQWDYPNIWSPMEYITVIGLLKYGFLDSATRIMKKSIAAHAAIYRKYQTFYEKIDGTTGDKTGDYYYKTQKGFGWTNAAFYRYIQILQALENNEKIFDDSTQQPPYTLCILH